MKDIIYYTKKNQDIFEDVPFNNVDALILAWFSYYDFKEEINKERKIGDLSKLFKNKYLYEKAFVPNKSKRLLKELGTSKRFSQLDVVDYIQIDDESLMKQFSAMVIRLEPEVYYISFRGTDPSFNGWRENFNLSYLDAIPSQLEALKYTESIMNKYPGKYYLGGHSKGGNIATYVGAYLESSQMKNVIAVYSFDGPGFRKDIFHGLDIEKGNKLLKFVPACSYVGMIFEFKGVYKIIKSNGFLVYQHDPFTWEIKNNDFVYETKRSHSSLMLDSTLNNWIDKLSDEDRERFVGIVFYALNNLKIRDFNSFFSKLFFQIPILSKSYRSLSKEDKKFFKETLKLITKK